MGSPRDLLRAIASERLSADDLEQFSQLHILDQGRFLEQQFGHSDFMRNVWTKLNNHEFSQYHTLLAKLPCNEVLPSYHSLIEIREATTNDQMTVDNDNIPRLSI
jgi:hypothetical protein